MPEALVNIEVAYATAERQWLLACEVPAGTRVRDALRLSGLGEQVPGLDLASCPVGIFGKVVSDPAERTVEEGDRLEVYRPLLVDPKEVRRQRAAKAKAQRGA
ncbi:RnfH family protein [Pseudomonas guariconensis]|uniref:RnfH family protein n=1 Tax=Pseudomonas TaxID=286 RepID=UPI00209796E3|nr:MULTISPECIES: RnfH family protein [Pseudomonas]MCO7515463.1 RnfH family protein [Pseudomonas putida]MCO7605556.1 RnfH family protein [Pseudomonas guariconensis]